MGCFSGSNPLTWGLGNDAVNSDSGSASQPTSPSVSSSMADYVANYPKLMALQQQYAPQEAAMNLQLAQQYAEPYGKAYAAAQSAMYPQTTALQENLAGVATQGMQSQVPDWMKAQYQSDMNAQLGTNVSSPIGSDYMSRGLLQQQEEWQRYYQNLGLSVTGRQPLTQATTPATTNQLSTFNPSTVMGMNSNTYGTQSSMYNNNQNIAAQGNPYMNSLMGVGGMALGGYMGRLY
jgi:hypothetical protein